jgi:hypothetical protein
MSTLFRVGLFIYRSSLKVTVILCSLTSYFVYVALKLLILDCLLLIDVRDLWKLTIILKS